MTLLYPDATSALRARSALRLNGIAVSLPEDEAEELGGARRA